MIPDEESASCPIRVRSRPMAYLQPLLTDAAEPKQSRRAAVNRPYLIGEDNF